jgi:hypothetical protein
MVAERWSSLPRRLQLLFLKPSFSGKCITQLSANSVTDMR